MFYLETNALYLTRRKADVIDNLCFIQFFMF